MALVKRSTPKSRSTQSLDRVRKNLAVHVSLSVFNFQTAALNQRQVRNRSLGNNPQHPGEAQKRRRSAAAPSRWAVYRRGPHSLSTRFLKFFRQPLLASHNRARATSLGTSVDARPRAETPDARKQPHSHRTGSAARAAGLIPAGETGMVRPGREHSHGRPFFRYRAGPAAPSGVPAPMCSDLTARALRSRIADRSR